MSILRDCHNVSSDGNGVSTNSVALTTTTTNVILYLIAHQSDLSNDRTFNTPTDTVGLTWTRRFTRHHQATSGATSWNNVEIWWALMPTAGAITITQTISSATNDHWVLECSGWSGLNTGSPFDPDAGLPYFSENHTNSNANPSKTGVTTTNSNDVAIAIYTANENFVPSTSLAARMEPGVGGAPGGFTATTDFTPSSGSLWERLCTAYKVLSAPLASVTHTVSLNSNHTTFIIDALTADSGATTSTIAQTLGVIAQSATVSQVFVTSIAQTLHGLAQEADVGALNTTIAQTLSTLAQNALVFEAQNYGPIAQTLHQLRQSATVAEIDATTIAQTLARVKQVVFANVPKAPGTGNVQAYWTAGP